MEKVRDRDIANMRDGRGEEGSLCEEQRERDRETMFVIVLFSIHVDWVCFCLYGYQ